MDTRTRGRAGRLILALLVWLVAVPLVLFIAGTAQYWDGGYPDGDPGPPVVIALFLMLPVLGLVVAGFLVLLGAGRWGWGIVAGVMFVASAVPYAALFGAPGWYIHGVVFLLFLATGAMFLRALATAPDTTSV